MLNQADYDKSGLYDYASPKQKISGYLALLCAFIALIFLILWMNVSLEDSGLGGFDFDQLIFNFHPVFMYTGMILLALTSLLSYRILPFTKYFTKKLHGFLHTLALLSVTLGLSCAIIGNNYKSKNDQNTYYTNLTSIHSFIGLGALLVYFQNYVLGAYHFLSSLESVPVENRKDYMPIHVFLGTFAFILSLIAVEAGVMEIYAEKNCYYDLDGPDLNPASNYHKLPYGCRIANGFGVMVMLVALFGLFAIYNFRGEKRKSESSYLLEE